ncbi:MAG: GTPase ObgE [Candidatus Omnitrophota bacterium]
MFIDEAKIYIKAGDGGKGCHCFYRDKYQRRGIPDGGNGGTGADIITVASKSVATLLDFQYHRHFVGQNGKHGSGKNKRGKDAEDLVIKLPCGTIIRDAKTNCSLAELTFDEERVVLAKGGRGGIGNTHNRLVTNGERGQEREIILVLKLIADVGIVGFPNAGKSTLICAISNAHSKVASYHFTTKAPVLGVVKGDKAGAFYSFVVADIPGLIQGSYQGRGLGDRFLRHIERTKLILHIIDMAGLEGRDPLDDYRAINKELALFSQKLGRKKQIIIANKIDLPEAKANLIRFKQKIKKSVYPISALKKQGLEELIEAIRKKL